MATMSAVDARGLATALRRRVRGEVRFDAGSRALYATDGSNYRKVPIGVVIPRDVDDVVAVMGIARQFGAPVLSRGGGTSLAGQCCNVAVVMDFSKYMHRIIDIDPGWRIARVEPGCVLDDLRNLASQRYGLMFAPDPETHSHCTLGGMLGNNSCGVHSVMAQFEGNGARTSDNVESMTVLTYDGLKMKVGATSEEEFQKIISEGGRKAEIYRQLKIL